MRLATVLFLLLAVAGCSGGEPAHYYVWCDDTDAQGWKMVDFEEDDQGFILACTYQSPDRSQSYTARCRDSGCD